MLPHKTTSSMMIAALGLLALAAALDNACPAGVFNTGTQRTVGVPALAEADYRNAICSKVVANAATQMYAFMAANGTIVRCLNGEAACQQTATAGSAVQNCTLSDNKMFVVTDQGIDSYDLFTPANETMAPVRMFTGTAPTGSIFYGGPITAEGNSGDIIGFRNSGALSLVYPNGNTYSSSVVPAPVNYTNINESATDMTVWGRNLVALRRQNVRPNENGRYAGIAHYTLPSDGNLGTVLGNNNFWTPFIFNDDEANDLKFIPTYLLASAAGFAAVGPEDAAQPLRLRSNWFNLNDLRAKSDSYCNLLDENAVASGLARINSDGHSLWYTVPAAAGAGLSSITQTEYTLLDTVPAPSGLLGHTLSFLFLLLTIAGFLF